VSVIASLALKPMTMKVMPMIVRAIRYVHDREIPKVLAEDLMTPQQQGQIPYDLEICLSNAITYFASDGKETAVIFPKTGIIREG
jgi:hypothetical protein